MKKVPQIKKIPNKVIIDLIAMAEISIYPESVLKPIYLKLEDLFGETKSHYTFTCITKKNNSGKTFIVPKVFTVPKFKYKAKEKEKNV
jgi:hypothetical protein